MTIVVCRVACMPYYRSDGETVAGGGSYVDVGNVPLQSLNFLATDDTCHGFVDDHGHQIRLERPGGLAEDEVTTGTSPRPI